MTPMSKHFSNSGKEKFPFERKKPQAEPDWAIGVRDFIFSILRCCMSQYIYKIDNFLSPDVLNLKCQNI